MGAAVTAAAAAAAVVDVVVLEAVGAMPHTAVLVVAVLVVVLVLQVACAALTHLALVSGMQDRCKAQCSCLGPSSKPRLSGTWISTCSKGNNHNN